MGDVANADEEIEARVGAFDGTEFIVSRRRWLHILDRHAELGGMIEVMKAIALGPDEVFVDPRGTLHLVKGSKEATADFLVVIARKEGSKTYLVTAYPISAKRKKRRYRKFKKLPLS